jgi:cellulose biosynthesis protein BcsQ
MSFNLCLCQSAIHARFRKAVRYFDSDPNINVSKEIGKYHQNKQNWKEAIHYELANEKSTAVDIETNLLLLQAYAETTI